VLTGLLLTSTRIFPELNCKESIVSSAEPSITLGGYPYLTEREKKAKKNKKISKRTRNI